jgi:hypothetical protein
MWPNTSSDTAEGPRPPAGGPQASDHRSVTTGAVAPAPRKAIPDDFGHELTPRAERLGAQRPGGHRKLPKGVAPADALGSLENPTDNEVAVPQLADVATCGAAASARPAHIVYRGHATTSKRPRGRHRRTCNGMRPLTSSRMLSCTLIARPTPVLAPVSGTLRHPVDLAQPDRAASRTLPNHRPFPSGQACVRGAVW